MVEGGEVRQIVHFLDSLQVDEFVVTFVHVEISAVAFLVGEFRQVLRFVTGVSFRWIPRSGGRF
jgi:hypothetical protein